MKTTLQTIQDRFCNTQHNNDNYTIGGGLDCSKFASNRHEDARSDEGKLTLGKQLNCSKKLPVQILIPFVKFLNMQCLIWNGITLASCPNLTAVE